MLRNAQYLKLPIYALGVFISCLSATLGTASEDIADQYPQSPLYQKPIEFKKLESSFLKILKKSKVMIQYELLAFLSY